MKQFVHESHKKRQDIPHDRTVTVRNTSRGWGENHTRSVSVPRLHLRTTQDYVTGIKPASHRIESHSSNCNVPSPTSTPNHSSTKYSGNAVQKQRRSSLTNQKEFFNLRISGLRREVWLYVLVLFSFIVIIQYSSNNCYQDRGNERDKEYRGSPFTRYFLCITYLLQFPCNHLRTSFSLSLIYACRQHVVVYPRVAQESGDIGKKYVLNHIRFLYISHLYKYSLLPLL